MNFDITEDQQRVQQRAREVATRHLAPRAAKADQDACLAPETIASLAEDGWFGLTIPTAQGGSGTDWISFALAIEELAVACCNSAALVVHNAALVGSTIAQFGSDEQKSLILSALLRGQTAVAFAPMDVHDLGGLNLTAEQAADGSFVLRGELGPVTSFGPPAHFIVFARTNDSVTCFIVPNDAPGLVATTLPPSLGKRAVNLLLARFEAVRVPADAVLGAVGQGVSIALFALGNARIGAAAEAIGIARAAYEQAIAFVKQQPQKPPVPGLLGVQAMFADMCVDIEAARLLTLRAARLADAGEPSTSERSMAKLFASEMSTRIAHKSMQIHGARSVSATPGVERHYRDARMTELSDETTETQRSIIAQVMLKA